jgi:hypothetical protein
MGERTRRLEGRVEKREMRERERGYRRGNSRKERVKEGQSGRIGKGKERETIELESGGGGCLL